MKLTLCLLTWNELDGCKHDIPKIIRSEFEQLFAIDGGSTDGTVEYLKSQGIKVYKQKHSGLNMAHIEAVNKCKTDAIIFFHPKGTIPVSDLLKFRKYFERGYQLVVGSRIVKGGSNEEDNLIVKPRKWFVMTIAIIARVIWKKEGNFIFDVLHGFRGITVDTFKKMVPETSGLTIDIEGVIKSYKMHTKRIEFPTKETNRFGGVTHFKPIPTGAAILKYMLKELGIQL